MKISNFKLAYSILKRLCDKNGIVFSDISIYCGEDDIIDNSLQIGNTKNIAHTIYKIISEYVINSENIVGCPLFGTIEEQDNFLITLSSKLRTFLYQENKFYEKLGESTKQHLYGKPLIWILLKDIICPVYNVLLKDISIFLVDRGDIDIAEYCDNVEYFDDIDEPFIFLNDINNIVVQNAFLFVEALKAYKLSPIEVVKNIYESDLYEKFFGLLQLAFTDNELNDFECILAEILGMELFEIIPAQIDNKIRDHKVAQNRYPNFGVPFWFYGLTETMLERNRGADWTVYKDLQPYVEEFWNTVEDIKMKRAKKGKDPGVPFDELLRIKNRQFGDQDTDHQITIQQMLSSNRVW